MFYCQRAEGKMSQKFCWKTPYSHEYLTLHIKHITPISLHGSTSLANRLQIHFYRQDSFLCCLSFGNESHKSDKSWFMKSVISTHFGVYKSKHFNSKWSRIHWNVHSRPFNSTSLLLFPTPAWFVQIEVAVIQ